MEGAENNYNAGRPLPHHELDTLILQKVVSGQWRVAIRANGPPLGPDYYDPRDGWFLIQTSAPANR